METKIDVINKIIKYNGCLELTNDDCRICPIKDLCLNIEDATDAIIFNSVNSSTDFEDAITVSLAKAFKLGYHEPYRG